MHMHLDCYAYFEAAAGACTAAEQPCVHVCARVPAHAHACVSVRLWGWNPLQSALHWVGFQVRCPLTRKYRKHGPPTLCSKRIVCSSPMPEAANLWHGWTQPLELLYSLCAQAEAVVSSMHINLALNLVLREEVLVEKCLGECT